MQTTGFNARGPGRKRQTKFTPEKLQQIRNLVQQGTRREEIAEVIGVTVGSLQVTCSRLGISLRRVVRNNGTGLLRPTGSHSNNSVPVPSIKEQSQQKPATPSQGFGKTGGVDWANLALRMQYRGDQRTTELPLTQDMIRQLVFEAQFRDMSIGELVSEVIIAVMKKDLLQEVLEASSQQREAFSRATISDQH